MLSTFLVASDGVEPSFPVPKTDVIKPIYKEAKTKEFTIVEPQGIEPRPT